MGCGAYQKDTGAGAEQIAQKPPVEQPYQVQPAYNPQDYRVASKEPAVKAETESSYQHELGQLPPYERAVFARIGGDSAVSVQTGQLREFLVIHGVHCEYAELGADPVLHPLEFWGVIDRFVGYLAPEIQEFYYKQIEIELAGQDRAYWHASYASRLKEFGQMNETAQGILEVVDEPGAFIVNAWQLYTELRKREMISSCAQEFAREIAQAQLGSALLATPAKASLLLAKYVPAQ